MKPLIRGILKCFSIKPGGDTPNTLLLPNKGAPSLFHFISNKSHTVS